MAIVEIAELDRIIGKTPSDLEDVAWKMDKILYGKDVTTEWRAELLWNACNVLIKRLRRAITKLETIQATLAEEFNI